MPATQPNNDAWLAQQLRELKREVAALKTRTTPVGEIMYNSIGLTFPFSGTFNASYWYAGGFVNHARTLGSNISVVNMGGSRGYELKANVDGSYTISYGMRVDFGGIAQWFYAEALAIHNNVASLLTGYRITMGAPGSVPYSSVQMVRELNLSAGDQIGLVVGSTSASSAGNTLTFQGENNNLPFSLSLRYNGPQMTQVV